MINRICKQCGKEFTITDSEIEFFKSKNLELPKRCNECREKNKGANVNNNLDSIYKSNKNRKSLRKILAIGLILVLAFVAKVFNIDFNGIDLNGFNNKEQSNYSFTFRNDQLWEEHFLKHGSEFNYKSKEQYLNGAKEVITSSSSKYKKEEEDGDDIYYDVNKNEIVFVSEDGYIRTYFKPKDGIEYFNRQ